MHMHVGRAFLASLETQPTPQRNTPLLRQRKTRVQRSRHGCALHPNPIRFMRPFMLCQSAIAPQGSVPHQAVDAQQQQMFAMGFRVPLDRWAPPLGREETCMQKAKTVGQPGVQVRLAPSVRQVTRYQMELGPTETQDAAGYY